jgi:hypothetical protein
LLAVGYWIMTLALCVLLFLISIDYGIKKEVLSLDPVSDQVGTVDTDATTPATAASANAPRVRRRANRPTKRRR